MKRLPEKARMKVAISARCSDRTASCARQSSPQARFQQLDPAGRQDQPHRLVQKDRFGQRKAQVV